MILIIENDRVERQRMRERFYRLPLNTCGASYRYADAAIGKYPVTAIYIPSIESIPNPIGFCRRLKRDYPTLPLVAAADRESRIDLDALYAVTDNIPLRPIATVRVAEILCELSRLYTGRDHIECSVGTALSLNIYAHVAMVHQRILSLTNHSLAILRHLAEAHPRCVPSAELAECTSAPDRTRTTGCIRSLVFTINARAKMRTGKPIIAYRHGEGYHIHRG